MNGRYLTGEVRPQVTCEKRVLTADVRPAFRGHLIGDAIDSIFNVRESVGLMRRQDLVPHALKSSLRLRAA